MINGEEYLQSSGLIKALAKDLSPPYMNNLEVIKERLKELKNQYFKNNHGSISQVFSVSPKIQMNLLFNFESYEVVTKSEDIYLAEEKVVSFNVGKIKMNFRGKLRITQERKDGKPIPYNKAKSPYSTYGVIETNRR